jgi:hypothetical protein
VTLNALRGRGLRSALALITLALAGTAQAQNGMPPITPTTAPAEPGALPLYGADTPGTPASENWARAGASDMVVRNVTRPTLTPVLPDPAKAAGAAVIVAPSGAFMLLSMDHEGWKVAHALADRGIAAFVLKYRLLSTPADDAQAGPYMMHTMMAGLTDPDHMPTLTGR